MSFTTDLAAIAGKTIILSGKANYQQWAWSVEGTAKLGLFWSAYDGTNTPADPNNPTQKEACDQREMKALGLIMKTVNPVIALELQSMPDITSTTATTPRRPNAKEIWDNLKSKHQKSDAVTSLYDYRQLHRTTLIDDGTLEAQINHLFQLRSRCALNGLKLDDYQFAATILIALPNSYSQIADSLLANGKIEDLKVETVRAKILETEVRRKGETDPAANAIRKSGRSQPLKKKAPRGTCFECGKTGHWASRCPTKKLDATSSTNSPSKKDLGQDVRPWGRKPKPNASSTSAAVNNVQTSSPEYESTIYFYDRADISAESWLMDSGATDHMTPWGSDFATYVPYKDSNNTVTLGDGTTKLEILGKGTVRRWCKTSTSYIPMEMDNVLHVNGIKKRFLSTDRLVRKGLRVTFTNAGTEIRDSADRFCTVGVHIGPYYWHNLYPQNPNTARLNAVETLPIKVWHERMGHLNWDAIKRARQNDSPLIGIKLDLSEPHGKCEGCIAGKEKRRTFKSSGRRASHPLEVIHSDLAGPMETLSIGGNRFFVIFVDDHTRHTWVAFMKSKDQTLEIFKTFAAMIQNRTGRSIKVFRSDRGGEFMSADFSKFLEESGISREMSAPRTPQQNGLAERMMRTLVGSARAMLQHSGLSKGFWSEAVSVAAHIHNRSPRKGLDWKTPHELFHGRTPDVSYLRVFGCRAWVYTPKDQRKKWDANSQPMIFVGYETGSKAYRLWNPKTRSIVVSASVRFNESLLPRKSAQDPNPPKTSPPVEQYTHVPLVFDEDPPPTPQPVPTAQLPTPAPSVVKPKELPGPSISSSQPPPTSDNETLSDREQPHTPPTVTVPVPSTPEQPREDQAAPKAPKKPKKQKAKGALPTRVSQREKKPVQRYQPGTSVVTSTAPELPPPEGAPESLVPEGELELAATEAELEAAEEAYLQHVELFASVSLPDEPRTYHEAIGSPEADHWREAMDDEINSLVMMKTWEIVPRPEDRDTVESKWVYKVKYNANGEIARYKARLVAKGYTQVNGLDFNETYAPVTHLETIHLLFGLAVEKDWEIRQIDVKTAYLHGDLDEEIYMEAPDGLEIPDGMVLRLRKAIYGLKQAGRQWYLKLKSVLVEMGFKQIINDPHTFVYHQQEGDTTQTLVVPIYVDDLLPVGDKHLADNFETEIAKYFDVTVVGDASYFLGIRVQRDRDPDSCGLALDQAQFARTILERRDHDPTRIASTPLSPLEKLVPNTDPVENAEKKVVKQYQRDIGSLMYLMLGTRPDLAYAVGKLARFSANPSSEHLRALEHVFAYVNRTKFYCLTYMTSGNPFPHGYVDADFASDASDRKSISGYTFMIAGGAFSWSSKKQQSITTSTMEAEYQAAHAGSLNALWIRQFFKQIDIPFENPLILHCDNQGAIATAKAEQSHQRSKHIDIKYHSIREHIDRNLISLTYVPSKENLADIFTKSLPYEAHNTTTQNLGLAHIPTGEEEENATSQYLSLDSEEEEAEEVAEMRGSVEDHVDRVDASDISPT